jgi:hypothetical protein
VADLVRSILRQYFVGSLLLLRCDPNNPPFAPAFLRGAKPRYSTAQPELLVLDGQQRLTSFLYALTAPDLNLKDSSQRRWFFVNLDLLLTDPDDDEVVFDRSKPSVFVEARIRIGADGYRVRESASYASVIYSGIFCLLALRNARDWRRGESIQLQELLDHHIFPQDYLRRHGLTRRPEMNSIANRTLISDETNNKIKAKAPAEYIENRDIFPNGATENLLNPHFISKASVAAMKKAIEQLPNDEVAIAYEEFLKAREAAIVHEIRSVCGLNTEAASNKN